MKRLIARTFLKLTGFRIEGEQPPSGRYVVIAAPHTSNWDGIYLVLMSIVYGVRIQWMVKHTLLRFPFRAILLRLGAVPIERHLRKGVVDQMITRFREDESLHLIVPAEGTRSYRDYWKSGFYHIARGADVPVCLSYLDFKTKTGGFGPLVHLTGDVVADMDTIRAFYCGKVGKYPEQMSPMRLREEDEPVLEASGEVALDPRPLSQPASA